jgi:hypothetical protein
VFAEINALPGTQVQPAVADRHGDGTTQENGQRL